MSPLAWATEAYGSLTLWHTLWGKYWWRRLPSRQKMEENWWSSFWVSFSLQPLSAAWPPLCESLPLGARQVSRPQCLRLATYAAWREAVFSGRPFWPPCLLSSLGWCSCYLSTSWTAQGREWGLLLQMGGGPKVAKNNRAFQMRWPQSQEHHGVEYPVPSFMALKSTQKIQRYDREEE